MRRDCPSTVPDDRPLALVTNEARGQVITALNPPALAEGLATGLALADARAMLPGLLVRPAEPRRDRSVLMQLARWAGRYGPSRNGDGADGLWIDITGVAHLFRISDGAESDAETALIADLAQRLAGFGLTARIGLADTLGAAHALARFAISGAAGSVISPAGALKPTLASLPVEALRLDADAVVLLKRLGLRRIGQLYDLPRVALERRFGQHARTAARKGGTKRQRAIHAAAVLQRLDQALGLRSEPRRPLAEPPTMSARSSYAEPLITSIQLEAEVGRLLALLVDQLAASGRGARRISLRLERTDGSSPSCGIGLSRASRDADHLLALLSPKLEGLDAGFGIDGLALDCLEGESLAVLQHTLASDGMSSETTERITGLVDRMANRLGHERVLRTRMLPRHRPERAAELIPALAAAGRPTAQESAQPSPARLPLPTSRPVLAGGRAGQGEADQHGAGSAVPSLKAPRPALLLDPPEPIAVIAELPEGPPARFTWRRLTCRVVRAEGPERIAPEWWSSLGKPPRATDTTHAPRDYYRIEDQQGAGYWVFRHGLYEGADTECTAPAWYMHGLFT